MIDTGTLAQSIFIGLAVIAACVFGIAGLWGTHRYVSWSVRLAPISILSAALFPLGMFDFALLAWLQAVIACGSIWAGRALYALHANRIGDGQSRGIASGRTNHARWSRTRFQLVDVFKVFVLVAMVLGLASYAPDEWHESHWSDPDYYFTSLIGGAVLATLTLAGWCLAISSRRWALLGCGILALAAVGSVALVNQSASMSELSAAALAGCGQVLVIAVWLRLLAAAGWGWWTPRKTQPDLDELSLSIASPRIQSNHSVAARTALFTFSLICLVPLADLYLGLLPPSLPAVTLPKPNGYDELVRASNQLDWTAIPNSDPDAANETQCQQFVLDNRSALSMARQSLKLPSQVPLSSGSHRVNPDYQAMRNLCRALWLEARTHQAGGRPTDAMSTYFDALRLAGAASRGGVATDDLMAAAIEGGTVDKLAASVPDLDDLALATLISECQSMLATREPLTNILPRTRINDQLEDGWLGRLLDWLNSWDLSEFDIHEQLPKIRARRDARLWLLIVESALRRHELAHGKAPDSLAELVPEFLAHIPVDPCGCQPFVYRRINSRHVLYSVGQDGRDDGGKSKSDPTEGDLLLIPVP